MVAGHGERRGIEEMHLVGGLGRDDEVWTARGGC